MTDLRSPDEMVAYALEADPKLLPFLPELLSDLDELGSDAERITQAIGELDLSADTTVLDLGCGRGGVSVEIAETLGFRVTGIELFEPFLAACEALARTRGVGHLCAFQAGDVSTLAGAISEADLAVYAALGDVLGPLDETVSIIRRFVKPGGYLVISDVFLAPGASNDYPGFERYAEYEETIRRLTSSGDTLVHVLIGEEEDDEQGGDEQGGDEQGDEEDDEGALVQARAAAIAQRHPEYRELLMDFVRTQQEENDFIEENLLDAIWVLKRAPQ